MYVPSFNAVTDPAELAAMLGSARVAQLVTFGRDGLEATIVPILYDPGAAADTLAGGALGRVRLHLARANQQWLRLDNNVEALLIISGPDAYVSPGYYPSKAADPRVVPTWNYETLQARGRVVVHDDARWTEQVVRDLTDRHESARPEPWSVEDAPGEYIAKMLGAIVGVEVQLSSVQAKRKLSQNRQPGDVDGVVAALAASDRPGDQAVATAMRNLAGRADVTSR